MIASYTAFCDVDDYAFAGVFVGSAVSDEHGDGELPSIG
jgi:hypothetical protein